MIDVIDTELPLLSKNTMQLVKVNIDFDDIMFLEKTEIFCLLKVDIILLLLVLQIKQYLKLIKVIQQNIFIKHFKHFIKNKKRKRKNCLEVTNCQIAQY